MSTGSTLARAGRRRPRIRWSVWAHGAAACAAGAEPGPVVAAVPARRGCGWRSRRCARSRREEDVLERRAPALEPAACRGRRRRWRRGRCRRPVAPRGDDHAGRRRPMAATPGLFSAATSASPPPGVVDLDEQLGSPVVPQVAERPPAATRPSSRITTASAHPLDLVEQVRREHHVDAELVPDAATRASMSSRCTGSRPLVGSSSSTARGRGRSPAPASPAGAGRSTSCRRRGTAPRPGPPRTARRWPGRAPRGAAGRGSRRGGARGRAPARRAAARRARARSRRGPRTAGRRWPGRARARAASPPSGGCMPSSRPSSVVLPAPLAPSRPVTPSPIARVAPSSAVVAPQRFTTPAASMIGAIRPAG